MHLTLPLEKYRAANGGVTLKLISEMSKAQEESYYNFRYTSQFSIPGKFTTKLNMFSA